MKIAMIMAFKDFRDEEYFTPRRIFNEAGAEVKVVSNQLGTARGADGGDVGAGRVVRLRRASLVHAQVIVRSTASVQEFHRVVSRARVRQGGEG